MSSDSGAQDLKAVRNLIKASEAEVTGSKPYAEALLNAASKDGQVDAVLDELDEIRKDVLKAHPKFAEILKSPVISAPDKERILKETFDGRATPIVSHFLHVLNRHGRLGLLDPIVDEARLLWEKRQNRRWVLVQSAVPLNEGEKSALYDRLARMTGMTPVLKYEVKPEILGGLVLLIGDRRYDTSVRSQLERLRRNLVATKNQETRQKMVAL